MQHKNLAVELLKKLLEEQVVVYKRTNIVKSEMFSDRIKRIMNQYINAQINNGIVIEEVAFYDALTKPQAIKDFYENDQLVALTKELTETLRRSKTIDWQKRETARAKMRMMIKKLLKKYKYPPEGMEDALTTVMMQCELWTDNESMDDRFMSYKTQLRQ